MEIILLQDVARLGSKDDLLTVKNGFGRNFLIPQKMAVIATESAKKVLAENTKQKAHKQVALDKIRVLGGALISHASQNNGSGRDAWDFWTEKYNEVKDLVIKVGAKAGETGKIFGSVNTIMLAEAINSKGFEIDRKQIIISEDSVKEVGNYTAKIKLHKEVIVELGFEVVSE